MRQYLGINGPAGWSLAAIALVIVVLGLRVPALLGAVLSFGRGDDKATKELETSVAKHSELMETYRERFLGRSLFDTPRPTPVVRERTVEPVDRTPPPPTPPEVHREPPPSAFAIFGDEVWFKPMSADEGILIIRVGEEKQGLKVLSISPPMFVTVSYLGHEHELTLYEVWNKDLPGGEDLSDATIPGQIVTPEEEEEQSEPEKTEDAGGPQTETEKPATDPAASPGEDDEDEVADDEPEKDGGQEDDGKDVPPDEPGKQSTGDPAR